MSNGGLLIEWHEGGASIEIEVAPDGSVLPMEGEDAESWLPHLPLPSPEQCGLRALCAPSTDGGVDGLLDV